MLYTERRDDAGQRDHRADGKIDAAADDDHRHADRADGDDHRLRKDDAKIERRKIFLGTASENRKGNYNECQPEKRPEGWSAIA